MRNLTETTWAVLEMNEIREQMTQRHAYFIDMVCSPHNLIVKRTPLKN